MHQINDDGRVIRVTGEGFFAADEARQHFDTLAKIIENYRRTGRPVRALIDLSKAVTQSASVANIITEATERLYCDPLDSVAIVVPTILLKLQFKRVHQRQSFHVCLTSAEAEQVLAAAPALPD